MKASIIIPAFNAQKTIRECLTSLLQQAFSKNEFEIIVIDDGSMDQTSQIVSEFKSVTLSAQKNAGPAVARNRGAKKASGEIVVFLDSDCVPQKNWLSEILDPFSDPNVAGAQGRYENGVDHWMAQFVQLEIEERYERQKKSMQKKSGIDFVSTYSAAYRKKIFLDNGGFDEGFRTASGEDTDLSFRLSDKGFRLVFAPDAIVRHFHPTSLLKYFKTKFFRAYWRALLYAKHPKKIAEDSYTNPLIKLQMAAAAFLAVFAVFGMIFSLAVSWLLAVASLLALLIFSIPPAFFILKKNFYLGILALPIFGINAFLFDSGYLYGKIKLWGQK